jgi:gliding motility-associated-like protein
MSIKIIHIFLGLLFCLLANRSFAQPDNNTCANAERLCPDEVTNGSNLGASSTFCPNCEDDFNYCFTGENTVWYYFNTNNTGGDVEITINNIVFENNPGQGQGIDALIISAQIPCLASTYDLVSNCENNEIGPIVLNAINLEPDSSYYLIINGSPGVSQNAEATFDIQISGAGVDKTPFIFIDYPDPILCLGQPMTIVATIEDCYGQGAIDWFINGEPLGTTVDNFITITEHFDGATITASVFCEENCNQTLFSNNLLLDVVSFTVDAGPDFEIFAGDTVQLEGFSTENDSIYWTPDLSMSNSNSLNPFVGPSSTTQYFLHVSNGQCTLVDEMTVFVISELEIPNTFTPNGDGINDKWEIPGIEKYSDALVQVYSRTGQLVFQTSGYNSPDKRWDGTSKRGNELTPGVYFYVINLRTEDFPEPLKGHVTIIR